ncbi:MAG: phosphatidylinositol-3-phosphatase, partial [Thermoleophilaceae bacterium]|nr:phosphatidylinositol-3-phosphatase [Thermoleophilaceae bacterium]
MRLLGILTALAAALALPAASPAATAPPPIKHVFVIVLENKSFEESFGPNSQAPYLANTLRKKAVLLQNYYGTSHFSLGNYITMISGQAANPTTQADCPVPWNDIVPGTIGSDGQVIGQGCVYPKGAKTIANQLDDKGLPWRGYMEDMGTPCRHPVIGTQDDTQQAEVGDQYAARHNPFMYFHSIIDDNASCEQHVVDLSALTTDLADPSTTANLSFITPDLCHDGHDSPCVDGQPGGLVSADLFLQEWVPKILDSSAFKDDGMLIVTFDEGEVGNPSSATACCGEVPGPNSPQPGIDGPGGGRTGAVVLSSLTAPGSVNDTPYNHYALLRTIEDAFGLDHLGFAGASNLQAFGPDVFNAASSSAAANADAKVNADAGTRS